MLTLLFLDDDLHSHFPTADRDAIREVANATEAEDRALLPGLTEVIELVSETGFAVIPELGAEGWANTLQRVTWMVDPTRPGGIAGVARSQLRHLLFHEFHHLARGSVIFPRVPRKRFIDEAISEGLATAFERDFSGSVPPYGQYGDQVEEWVRELLELPPTAFYDHWMFQHPDGRKDIGYKSGTYLADRAMAASGRSSADLVRTTADEILSLAGYGD